MDQEGTDCQGRQQAQQEKGYYAILLFRKAIKGGSFQLRVLNKWDPNLYIRSSLMREGRKKVK